MRIFKAIFYGMSACLLFVNFSPDLKSAARDFGKIRDAYNNAPKLSMDVVYKVYQGHESKVLVEEHTGQYLKMGDDKLYMQLFGTLTIQNKEIMMVKDDSSKAILLKKPAPGDKKQPTVDIEKLLQVCEKVESLPGSGGISGYKMEFGKQMQEMKAIEIYFDSKSFLVSKVILFYNREFDLHQVNTTFKKETYKPRLEVQYQHINTNPDLNELKFSVDKYIRKANNKWKLQSGLAGYQLLDQTLPQ